MKRRLLTGLGVLLGVLVLATLGALAMPSRWEAGARCEIGSPTEAVVPWVSTAEAWPRWLGWEADLDGQLRWAAGPDGTMVWSGPRLGEGALAVVATGGLSWDVTLAPAEGVAWHGQLVLEPSERSTAVSWTTSGDYGALPWSRFLGGAPGDRARDRMQRALSRLERAVESTLAREAREAAAREAAEEADRRAQADIEAQNAAGERAAGD